MNHSDGVDETADALRHTHWLAAIQRVAELLQRVQVLHVVFGLVGRVRQLVVLQVPHLTHATSPHVGWDLTILSAQFGRVVS